MPTVPDIHRRGTRAQQATLAAPPLTVGTLYFVTDEGKIERWTGSAWESYSGVGGAGGLGDVVGPASSVADRIAVFNGTTGKLIKDGGVTIAGLYSEYDAGNSGTALTIDWTNGRQQKVTLTGNVTFILSNPVAGTPYRLILVQDATGGRTVTWPSSVKWENDTAPTLVTTANKLIFVSLVRTNAGAGGYLGFATTNSLSQP